MIGYCKTGLSSAHKVSKLFVYYFNNHLAGSQAFHNLFADGTLCNSVCKILGNFIVYVRFKQSHANLTHCAFNVSLGKSSLAFQTLKRSFKSV